MSTYNATVTREGKWWMVAIPELDGLTQARRLSEAADMAREYIAATKDLPLEEVAVRLTVENVGRVTAVSERLHEIEEQRRQAEAIEKLVREKTEELAKALAAEVPLRDVGTMLGVSHQRAHQLVTH